MKSLALVSFFSFLITALASKAFSADGQSNVRVGDSSSRLESGFTPFLGLGGGLTTLDNRAHADAPAGALKIIGSYATNLGKAGAGDYVFDLGLGLQNQQFARRLELEDVTHRTLELAARYRWASLWQAGFLWNTHFEKGASYGSDQGDAQFLGLQILKQFTFGDSLIARLGGHVVTGVQTESVGATTAMLDLHVGWSKSKKFSEPAVSSASAPTSIAQATNPTPVAALARAELAKESLVRFSIGSSELSAADSRLLAKIGASLARGSSLFEKVTVIGHADSTGDEAQNQQLSVQRAKAVAAALVAAGVPQAKVESIGQGSTRPIDSSGRKEALGLNRRAALQFTGANNSSELSTILN